MYQVTESKSRWRKTVSPAIDEMIVTVAASATTVRAVTRRNRFHESEIDSAHTDEFCFARAPDDVLYGARFIIAIRIGRDGGDADL